LLRFNSLKLSIAWKIRKIIDYNILLNIKTNEIIEISEELFIFISNIKKDRHVSSDLAEIIKELLNEGILIK